MLRLSTPLTKMVKESLLFVEFIYCYCGCGKTRPKIGDKNQEKKFIKGHQFKGKHHSDKSKKAMSSKHIGKVLSETHKVKIGLAAKGRNAGSKHYLWKGDKGDNISYTTLHQWVRRNLTAPEKCEFCGVVPPEDVANITGIYERDFSNWKYLCTKCHMQYDKKNK